MIFSSGPANHWEAYRFPIDVPTKKSPIKNPLKTSAVLPGPKGSTRPQCSGDFFTESVEGVGWLVGRGFEDIYPMTDPWDDW